MMKRTRTKMMTTHLKIRSLKIETQKNCPRL
jgi:hypothetical protein